MKHITGSLFLLLLLPFGGSGAVFTGQMLSVDSVAIPYATVYIPQLKQGTMTDAAGRWNLGNLPAGTYRVEFSCMGYEMQTEEIAVRTMVPVHRDILLRENAIRLPEIIVSNGTENPAVGILRKVRASQAETKKRVGSYKVRQTLDCDYDVRGVPAKFWKFLKFFLIVKPSYRRFVIFLEKHKLLKLDMYYEIGAEGKKEKAGTPVITHSSEPVTTQEAKTIVDVAKTESVFSQLDEIGEQFDTDKKAGKYTLTGTYQSGDKVIDILISTEEPNYKKAENRRDSLRARRTASHLTRELHVVEGDWAVFRYKSFGSNYTAAELLPGIWLPVSTLISFDLGELSEEFDLSGELNEKLDSLNRLKENPDLKKKERKKIDDIIEKSNMFKEMMTLRVKFAVSFKYDEMNSLSPALP